MSVEPTDPALVAAVNEAVDTAATTIEWEGAKFSLPPTLERLPARAVLEAERGHVLSFIEGALGGTGLERAFAAFAKNHDGREPDIEEIGPLGDMIAKHFGFEDSGE